MRAGRPKLHQVMLSESQREELEALARSRSLPHGLSRRAAGVLHASEGMPNTMIAERVSRHKFQSGKHCTKKDRLDERVDDVFRFTEIIQNNAGVRTAQHQLRVEQHHKGVTKTRLSVKNSRNNSQI